MWRCYASRIITHPKVLLMPLLPSLLVILQRSFKSLPSLNSASQMSHESDTGDVCSTFVKSSPSPRFLAFGAHVRRHRRSFNPLEARFVARKALLVNAEFDSKTFLTRFARIGSSSEKSICQALAIIHAQRFRCLKISLILSKVTQVSAHFTVQHSKHVCSRPVKKAADSALRASHDSALLTRVPSQH